MLARPTLAVEPTSALLARPTLAVRTYPHNSALSVAVSVLQPNLELGFLVALKHVVRFRLSRLLFYPL